MREVRIDYTKLGNTKYISHLDLNRVFYRAVRRAEIPIWYTEGFNPHPHFRYFMPLPLGVESKCESLDIRITDDNYSNALIKENLNAVLPEGIRVVSVHEPKLKIKDIYCAVYDITYTLDNATETAERIENIIKSDFLPAVKKVKRGKKKVDEEINLLPNVITYRLDVSENQIMLRILCLCGQNNNLNPMLFAKSLERDAAIDYESRDILKDCILDENYKIFK